MTGSSTPGDDPEHRPGVHLEHCRRRGVVSGRPRSTGPDRCPRRLRLAETGPLGETGSKARARRPSPSRGHCRRRPAGRSVGTREHAADPRVRRVGDRRACPPPPPPPPLFFFPPPPLKKKKNRAA